MHLHSNGQLFSVKDLNAAEIKGIYNWIIIFGYRILLPWWNKQEILSSGLLDKWHRWSYICRNLYRLAIWTCLLCCYNIVIVVYSIFNFYNATCNPVKHWISIERWILECFGYLCPYAFSTNINIYTKTNEILQKNANELLLSDNIERQWLNVSLSWCIIDIYKKIHSKILLLLFSPCYK